MDITICIYRQGVNPNSIRLLRNLAEAKRGKLSVWGSFASRPQLLSPPLLVFVGAFRLLRSGLLLSR